MSKFTIHYTDNAAARNRCEGGNSIDNYEFEGTLNQALNLAAYTMCDGLYDPDEDEWAGAVDNGDWENLSDADAIESMNRADLGAGSPVVFWIEDENGNRVYEAGIDESDWETSEDDDDYDNDEDDDE